MRDLGLARRQLFGGLLAFIVALILSLVVTWPQYCAWQELKAQKNGLSTHKPATLMMLPDLTVLSEKQFKSQNNARLAQLCQQQGLRVDRVDTGKAEVNLYSQFPPGVQQVAVSVRARGAMADVKSMVKSLSETLPGFELTEVSFKALGPGALSPMDKEPKPMTVHVRGLLLVWKPEL